MTTHKVHSLDSLIALMSSLHRDETNSPTKDQPDALDVLFKDAGSDRLSELFASLFDEIDANPKAPTEEDETEAQPKINVYHHPEEGSVWFVILYNDDEHTIGEVVEILHNYFSARLAGDYAYAAHDADEVEIPMPNRQAAANLHHSLSKAGLHVGMVKIEF